jgi:hypothetical protein
MCYPGFASCMNGWGEDSECGCAGDGLSCADACPGELGWKALYRATVEAENEREAECPQDPTARWGPSRAGLGEGIGSRGDI